MSALRRRIGQLLASTHHVMAAGVGDVLLVVDELTSNALRHGAPPVELQLHCTPPDWLVLVTDHAVDTALAPTSTRDPAQGGMGLTMVARVATATGWQRANGSEQIWAVVLV